MAGYGYNYRGHSTYSAPRPMADDSTGGRRKTIISYVPEMNADVYCFVTKTETAYDLTSVLAEYHNRDASPERARRPSSPVHYRVEDKHFKPASPVHYRVEDKHVNPASPVHYRAEDKHFKPASPVHYRAEDKHFQPASPVHYRAEDKHFKPASPVHYRAEDKLFQPASPVHYRVEEKHFRPESPVRDDHPKVIKEYLAYVQNEASKADRSRPINPSYWHHTPNSYQVDTAGDLPSKGWSKPIGNNFTYDASDDYYYREPAISEKKPRPRPNQPKWEEPEDASLSKPTSDVDAAMGLIRQAAKISGPDSKNSRYTVPVSTVSRTNGKNEIINSRDAQKRYGNPNLLYQEKEAYSGTIDSEMAAKKYGGTLV